MEVWFNPDSIVNKVSLKTIKEKYQVTYNSHDGGRVFKVYMEAVVLNFYPMETKGNAEAMMVTTVRSNYKSCTKIQINAATEAYRLKGMIEIILHREAEGMVCGNMITNCPITIEEVTNA